VDENNEVALKMTVAGDSWDRGVELQRRMEESRRFAQTQITNVRHVDSQTGDTEQIEMAAIYIPELPNEMVASPSPKPATNQKPKTSGAKPSARRGAHH
jgi:hypothetical protein